MIMKVILKVLDREERISTESVATDLKELVGQRNLVKAELIAESIKRV